MRPFDIAFTGVQQNKEGGIEIITLEYHSLYHFYYNVTLLYNLLSTVNLIMLTSNIPLLTVGYDI